MFKEAERKCLKKLEDNVSGSETFHAETGAVFCQPALFSANRRCFLPTGAVFC